MSVRWRTRAVSKAVAANRSLSHAHWPRRERRHRRLGGRPRSSTFASAQNPGKGGAYDEPFSDSGSRFAMDMPLAGCNALAAFGRRRRFGIGAVGRGCVARKRRALRLGPPRLHRCRSGRHLGSSGLTGFNQAVRSGSYLLSPLCSHADEALRVLLREGRIVLREPADQVRLGLGGSRPAKANSKYFCALEFASSSISGDCAKRVMSAALAVDSLTKGSWLVRCRLVGAQTRCATEVPRNNWR